MTQEPLFTVLIYTEHGAAALAETLAAIAAQQGMDGPAQVVVVDPDASGDRKDVAGHFGAVYFVPARRDRASAWNEGIKEARGDIVAFTDDDCVPAPDWLAQYRRVLTAGTVFAGGPDKVPENAPRFLRYLDYILTSLAGSAGLRTTEKRGEAYYPRHWNMAMYRSHLLEGGGFRDTDALEQDIADRLKLKGGKIAFVPGAAVQHRRETDVVSFLSGNVRLARARARLPKRRLIFAAPAIGAAAGLALLAAAIVTPAAFPAFAVITVAYGLVLIGSGLHASFQMRDPLAALAVPPLLLSQHLTHAIGYGAGLLAWNPATSRKSRL